MTAAKSGTKRTSNAPVGSATNDLPTAVLVVGVFDLFHVGHVRLLDRARRCGDRLVVAINGDDLVREYKRQPIFNEHSRLESVVACRHVDSASITHSYDVKPLIAQFGIDVIVHGDEWERQSYSSPNPRNGRVFRGISCATRLPALHHRRKHRRYPANHQRDQRSKLATLGLAIGKAPTC